jgi:hypothetical protein
MWQEWSDLGICTQGHSGGEKPCVRVPRTHDLYRHCYRYRAIVLLLVVCVCVCVCVQKSCYHECTYSHTQYTATHNTHYIRYHAYLELTQSCSVFRIPEPIRQADLSSRDFIREWKKNKLTHTHTCSAAITTFYRNGQSSDPDHSNVVVIDHGV